MATAVTAAIVHGDHDEARTVCWQHCATWVLRLLQLRADNLNRSGMVEPQQTVQQCWPCPGSMMVSVLV